MNYEYSQPHYSSFSIDRSTVIALGSSQPINPHGEPPPHSVPQWNPSPVEHYPPAYSDQAGDEFLRCIAANKPLPDYLKGDMAYNLADALKSVKSQKEAVTSEADFQKCVTRSKSQSRGRSRGQSRAKSRAKSRSRARSRSRVRSRSRGRSKSRARGKSRARSKSRRRSRSRNGGRSMSRSTSRCRNKSHGRSRSRVRRSESQSSSSEKSYVKDHKRKSSPSYSGSNSTFTRNNLTGKSLLEGLKLVMSSKDLEQRLPTLKDAILTIQASGGSREVQCTADKSRHQEHDGHNFSTSAENDSILLPHERVGSDFSWLQAVSHKDLTVQKSDELVDEETFLYGDEELKHANESSAAVSALSHQQHNQTKFMFSSFGDQTQMTSASLDSSECKKVNNTFTGQGAGDLQGHKEGKHLLPIAPSLAISAMNNPNVQQALESLQSLIKATKEKRTKSDNSGPTGTSHVSEHKATDDEELKKEKWARIDEINSLMSELRGLLKQDGSDFLTPVIGFYCQKCDEFIGDLSCTEKHVAIHKHSNSTRIDSHAGESKGNSLYFSSSSNQDPYPADRKDYRDCKYGRGLGDYRDNQNDWRNDKDHRSKVDDCTSNRAKQENVFLQDEMCKERILITVPCGLSPPNVRVTEKVHKEQVVKSSSVCQDVEGKTLEVKSPKKKERKQKKKKKKKTKKEEKKAAKS